MKRLVVAASCSLLFACGDSPPPATPAPPPPAATSTAEPTAASTSAPVTAEPSPEEKKKAEDARLLKEDRAKWDDAHAKEVARWTPEIHAAAKALADKDWPSGKAAITEIAKGKHRAVGAADRD